MSPTDTVPSGKFQTPGFRPGTEDLEALQARWDRIDALRGQDPPLTYEAIGELLDPPLTRQRVNELHRNGRPVSAGGARRTT